jgi:hypothetical protein
LGQTATGNEGGEMKNQDLTPLLAQELVASKAALQALRHPNHKPAPPVCTQAPDQTFRNSKAWSQGWRWGYYHHDEVLQTDLQGQELKWFMAGMEAGYYALEVIELIPDAFKREEMERREKKARRGREKKARRGRTCKREV